MHDAMIVQIGNAGRDLAKSLANLFNSDLLIFRYPSFFLTIEIMISEASPFLTLNAHQPAVYIVTPENRVIKTNFRLLIFSANSFTSILQIVHRSQSHSR